MTNKNISIYADSALRIRLQYYPQLLSFFIIVSPSLCIAADKLGELIPPVHHFTEILGWILFFLCLLIIISLMLLLIRYKKSTDPVLQLSARLKFLFDNIPDFAWLKEKDCRYIAVNKTVQNACKVKNNEIAGKTDFDLWPADIAKKYHEDDLRVISSRRRIQVEEKFIHHNGSEITLETIKVPYFDDNGDIAGTVGIGRDITQQKQVETELTTSREKFFKLFYSSPNWLLLATVAEGRYLDVNDAFCQTTGYTREDVIGRTSIEFGLWINPDDRSEIKAMLEENGKFDAHPSQFRMKDGSLRDFLWSAVVIEINGETCALSTLVDITEIEKTRREKEKLQEHANQDQKMKAIGTLAGGVAHDFNNMLSVIIGHTQLAMLTLDESHPLFQRLTGIHEAADRAANLCRQLLAFARKQTITLQVLDLNKTVEGMLNMLRRLIGENVTLSWSPGKDLASIKMDPSQIDQILVNLCVNARDAIPDTGRIIIETDSVSLDEAYCSRHTGFVPGDYIQLVVSDTGCGMDAKTLSLLFEPFFTTKETGKGTGLGMAMVYGIVKQNNGFINVHSEPDKGTTFRLYFPRCSGQADLQGGKAWHNAPSFGNETILLVEDGAMVLDITRTMLETQGYTVLAAATPEEAINLAKEHGGEIDLLLTDVIMPEMNGRDLSRHILGYYPNIKSMFMSGYTADIIAHHGVLDEGVHFIQKPFSMKDLGAKLREALEGRLTG
jgi:two-component system cell cycle sensor histidine kinase/response regulator CckA